MALNPNYILLDPLQNLFRDKDTGLPLSAGFLLFFADNQRTVGKQVFQITGSPPNYSYIPYGSLQTDGSWIVNLNMVGALDNNLYYYPFDSNGNIQLYYIEVYNSGGVLQFTREAEPNFTGTAGNTTATVEENFAPNGQFLLHTNIPGLPPNIPNGRVQQPITNIAYGGWTFERPSTTTAEDNVVFERFGSWSDTPEADPRYSCRISCQEPDSGDTFKDLRLKFKNVNRFSSDALYYTYGFTAFTNTSENLTVQISLVKNFGIGGSTSTTTVLGSIIITPSIQNYFISFIPGDNSGKTIGLNDDDYIQLAITLPTDSIADTSFTDMIFCEGQFLSSSPPFYPQTTDSQTTYEGLSGFLDVPDYNAKDLYLPIILSPTGLTYDTSVIGKIYASSYSALEKGELNCDGSQYLTSGYSSDGIPYSRLQEKYFISPKGMPLWGTGLNFVSTYYTNSDTSSPAASLRIYNNSQGAVPNFTDGSVSTGFTFNNVCAGSVNAQSWGLYNGANSFYIWGKQAGSYNSSGGDVVDSGFTLTPIRTGNPADETILTKSIVNIMTVPASGLAGKWFEFNATTGFYYLWYKVNGVGSDPAPAGALGGIECDLQSIWDAAEVAKITAAAISGSKITNIVCTAGSAITPGSYFNLNTATQNYYVWYIVDGVGTDPAPADKIGIPVNISASSTAIQVGSATLNAINGTYFAVPDLRGMFLRGTDGGAANIDTDYQQRWAFYNQTISADQGNLTASFEFDQITQHNHHAQLGSTTAPNTDLLYGQFLEQTGEEQFPNVFSSGGSESRPINTYINWVVKY
jgi:hypothetical protein